MDEYGSGSEESTCPDCGSLGTQYWDTIDGDEIDDGFVCSNPNCPLPEPKDDMEQKVRKGDISSWINYGKKNGYLDYVLSQEKSRLEKIVGALRENIKPAPPGQAEYIPGGYFIRDAEGSMYLKALDDILKELRNE